MLKSMWWSHIPNIDFIPVLSGRENDTVEPGAGGNDAGEPGGAGGSQADDQNLDPQKKITALNEEKDRHFQARTEAEKKLADADAELEELRNFKKEKDQETLTSEEKVAQQIDELTKTVEQKEAQIQLLTESSKKLVIRNAFLAANDVKWHNAESALSLADLSGVEVVDGKDGVPALKDQASVKTAVEALAKSHPYLVDTTEGSPSWEGKTGDQPQRRKTTDAAAKRDKLLKDYPALRRG